MTRNKRPLPRAAQVQLHHNLPPYEPKAGDIVMAFHLFNEFDDAVDTLKKREDGTHTSSRKTNKEEIAKFRPCMVVYAQGDEALLVPVSSRRDQRGRHLEINEPSELEVLGLAPHKPAYARTLGIAKYDFQNNPLIVPVAGDDGKPSWVVGQAPTELVKQSIQDVSRQKKHGRLETIPSRFARDVPDLVADEMRRISQEAKEKSGPRRAIPRRAQTSPDQISESEMKRRKDAIRAHTVREKAAAMKARQPTQVASSRDQENDQI